MTSPLMCTEQAPHCATPQPYFVPVRPTCSRMTHSSGVSASTCTSRTVPLILSLAIRPFFAAWLTANPGLAGPPTTPAPSGQHKCSYNRRRSSQERRGGLTPCKDRTSVHSRAQPAGPAHRHPRHRAGGRAGGVLRADAGGLGRRRRSRWSRRAAAPRAGSGPSTRTSRIPSAPCSSGSTTAGSARSCSTCTRRATESGSARWSPPPTCCWSRRRRGELDGVRAGRGRADAAVSRPDRRARVAVR